MSLFADLAIRAPGGREIIAENNAMVLAVASCQLLSEGIP